MFQELFDQEVFAFQYYTCVSFWESEILGNKPTGKSFRFVCACVSAVWLSSENRPHKNRRASSLFPSCLGDPSLFLPPPRNPPIRAPPLFLSLTKHSRWGGTRGDREEAGKRRCAHRHCLGRELYARGDSQHSRGDSTAELNQKHTLLC